MKQHQSIPIFENSYMERLTHIHPAVPLFFWTPIISFLFWKTFFFRETSLKLGLFMGLTGLLLWSLFEYSLHRFLFHFRASSILTKKLVYIFHGIHHDDPKDPTRLVMPLVPAILYGSGLYFIFCSVFGAHLGEGFLTFFFFGYLCYDYLHFAIHHFQLKSPLAKSLRKHHLIHHKNPHLRFGVSSPLWDYIFGTIEKK